MQAQADSACSFIGTSNNGYNYRMEFSTDWILGLPTPQLILVFSSPLLEVLLGSL